jgi:hypothetical protein
LSFGLAVDLCPPTVVIASLWKISDPFNSIQFCISEVSIFTSLRREGRGESCLFWKSVLCYIEREVHFVFRRVKLKTYLFTHSPRSRQMVERSKRADRN